MLKSRMLSQNIKTAMMQTVHCNNLHDRGNPFYYDRDNPFLLWINTDDLWEAPLQVNNILELFPYRYWPTHSPEIWSDRHAYTPLPDQTWAQEGPSRARPGSNQTLICRYECVVSLITPSVSHIHLPTFKHCMKLIIFSRNTETLHLFSLLRLSSIPTLNSDGSLACHRNKRLAGVYTTGSSPQNAWKYGFILTTYKGIKFWAKS